MKNSNPQYTKYALLLTVLFLFNACKENPYIILEEKLQQDLCKCELIDKKKYALSHYRRIHANCLEAAAQQLISNLNEYPENPSSPKEAYRKKLHVLIPKLIKKCP